MKCAYVHYGCGHQAPHLWRNFDASVTLRWERIPLLGQFSKNKRRFPPQVEPGDIVKGLPIEEGTCAGIYASHVLEHLPLDEFHIALTNTRRMLKENGVFRLVVPDLEWAAREYLQRLDGGDAMANHFFLRATSLGVETRGRTLIAGIQMALSTSTHQWMWDAASLRAALLDHDFRQVRRCVFGDSSDPMFQLVEDPGRFEHAVAMEGCR